MKFRNDVLGLIPDKFKARWNMDHYAGYLEAIPRLSTDWSCKKPPANYVSQFIEQ